MFRSTAIAFGAKGSLFLVLSQSGRSPDLLLSAEAARSAGALVVAMVNDEQSPLADLADMTIPLLAGPETSVAATKSYIAALAAIARLVACWSADGDLFEAVEELGETLAWARRADWTEMLGDLVDAPGAFVLGRGPTLAVAQKPL